MKQLEPSIKIGEYFSIPKGTIFHTISNKYSPPQPVTDIESVTSRDQVLKVSHIDAIYSNTETIDVDYNVFYCARNSPGIDQIEQRTERKIVGHHVTWAGTKYVDFAMVTNVAEPIRKSPDPIKALLPKEPTLRMKMVKNSKWTVTNNIKLWNRINIPKVGLRGNHYNDYGLEHKHDIPVDTEFKITGKSTSNYPSVYSSEITAVWLPVEIISDDANKGKILLLKLSDMKDNVVPFGVHEVIPVFYIWDTAVKKYYSGYDYGDYLHRSEEGDLLSHARAPNVINYSDKLSKAKSFKMLNLVRTHALIQSGYYDNLPDGWGQIPEWMMTGKAFDIPDTWEIVKIDKLTKKEIERVELVDTFNRTWKLRALTVLYGSNVRSVYSDLEKKGTLSAFSAMIYFSIGKNKDGHYRQDDLPQLEKDSIKDMLTQFDKKSIKIQKSQSGFAVAVKDTDTAMMVRLAYNGDLEIGIIDFDTMCELVYHGE